MVKSSSLGSPQMRYGLFLIQPDSVLDSGGRFGPHHLWKLKMLSIKKLGSRDLPPPRRGGDPRPCLGLSRTPPPPGGLKRKPGSHPLWPICFTPSAGQVTAHHLLRRRVSTLPMRLSARYQQGAGQPIAETGRAFRISSFVQRFICFSVAICVFLIELFFKRSAILVRIHLIVKRWCVYCHCLLNMCPHLRICTRAFSKALSGEIGRISNFWKIFIGIKFDFSDGHNFNKMFSFFQDFLTDLQLLLINYTFFRDYEFTIILFLGFSLYAPMSKQMGEIRYSNLILLRISISLHMFYMLQWNFPIFFLNYKSYILRISCNIWKKEIMNSKVTSYFFGTAY